MITVKYQLRHDEKDQVISVFERKFENTEKQVEWESKQKPHPFLTLKTIKVTDHETV